MLMRKLLLASIATILSVSPTLACSLPSNWDKIVDRPTKEVEDKISVFTGVVESIRVEKFENKSCILLDYSAIKQIAGTASGPYQLANCLPEYITSEELKDSISDSSDEIARETGLFENAEVIVFATKQKLNIDAGGYAQPPKGFFRPMQLTCWPLFQVEIGKFDALQKQDFIESIANNFQQEISKN